MNDVSLGLAHEAEVMLRKVGATRENFWVPISKDEELARRVFELVNVRPTYDVVVDYSRSLAEMVKAVNYDWVNDDINADHFPVKGKDQHKLSVTLFHFNRDMESDDVIAEMDKQGYRPARIEELLALGEGYPDLQREFPIIALGSVWRNRYGNRSVPSLCRDGSERHLYLDWFDYRWPAYCRFAAVRK